MTCFDISQLLNKTVEFEEAVRRVVTDVRLDNDIVVSVFETNIRVLGYDVAFRVSKWADRVKDYIFKPVVNCGCFGGVKLFCSP